LLTFLLALPGAGCATAPVNEDPLPTGIAGVDVGVLEQTFDSVALQVTLDVRSLAGAQAKGAHVEVLVNQRLAASVELPVHGTVSRDGALSVVLTPRFKLAETPEGLLALTRKNELKLTVAGTLTVERDGLTRSATFKKQHALPAPKELRVTIKDASAARYDHGEINLAFQLAVENPNAFPVRLRGLRYGLSVGGQVVGDDTLGQAEVVPGASTRLFELPQFLDASYDELNARLVKKGTVPYAIDGELATEPYSRRFQLAGSVRLSDQR
jgi:hypothetical protein